MNPNAAWARFLRTVAVAANQLAADLTDSGDELEILSELSEVAPESLVIGTRQRAIVAVPGLRDEAGLKTAEIARAVGSPDVPNIYLAMRALEKRGLVELVPNQRPQSWRLTGQFRLSSVV
ncbi:MAG TPA: hypothetical protein VNL16_19790 [Chloroflexota bacterium]|nr:hypothetical protein [Chloroflexota bacterium]